MLDSKIATARIAEPPAFADVMAYAAPVAGLYFFNIPMWSILPAIYAKYFGLSLASIGAVVLFIRLYDGLITPTIGFCSDWHRSVGGSRKPWVIVGGLGTIVACHSLFTPSQPVTVIYYFLWSLAYFLAHSMAEIPHLTWGSELTMDYHRRTGVYGVRSVVATLGFITFYALPLLPLYGSTGYTPGVLHDALYVGALMTVLGLAWTLLAAPSGVAITSGRDNSLRLYLHSIVRNQPLLLYFAAFACVGLCYGMWFGLLYFYLDSYLALGGKVAVFFFVATTGGVLSTPLWLKLIHKTSKSTGWALGVMLFCIQLIGMWFMNSANAWWIAFSLTIVAFVSFTSHNVATVSLLGDIVDYGKLKFRKDCGATYFACYLLIFQFGIGIGGGLSIGTAGLFGFSPSSAHTSAAILGLKLGFVILPATFALVGLLLIWRLPISRQRHRVIQRRLELRLMRSGV